MNEETSELDMELNGSNNEVAIAWAKQYLDKGYSVTIRVEYRTGDGGWKTIVDIKPAVERDNH